MKKNAETVLELEFEKCLDFLQTGLFDVYKVVILICTVDSIDHQWPVGIAVVAKPRTGANVSSQ
jgi:hypothetical protein